MDNVSIATWRLLPCDYPEFMQCATIIFCTLCTHIIIFKLRNIEAEKDMHIMILTYLLVLVVVAASVLAPSTNLTELDEPAPNCKYNVLQTSTTLCQLIFITCPQGNSLVKCTKNVCSRYAQGDDCKLWDQFILDQAKCYRECCGSSTQDISTHVSMQVMVANPNNNTTINATTDSTQISTKTFTQTMSKCIAFNSILAQQQTSSNRVLIIVLSVSIGILLLVTVILLIKFQCCCPKAPLKKYALRWRKDTNAYPSNPLCAACNTSGESPLLLTPCQHWYHLECFSKCKNMVCVACQIKLRGESLKVYCGDCKIWSYKVRVERQWEIQDAHKQARQAHWEVCDGLTSEDRIREQLISDS